MAAAVAASADDHVVCDVVDRFQSAQPNAQIGRRDLKRMLASLAVAGPADPVAYLDELLANPQSNERRPPWAANDLCELSLSTSSSGATAGAVGWAGSLVAARRPATSTVLDGRARRGVEFAGPDERVQARLERLLNAPRPASTPAANSPEPGAASAASGAAEPQSPPPPAGEVEVSTEVSERSVGPVEVGGADVVRSLASSVVDEMLSDILPSLDD